MNLSDIIEKYAKARSQAHVSLITIVGGYLLYLVYEIIKGILDGTGSSSALLLVFAGLFTVCGLLLCLGGVYALWKGWYKENSSGKGETAETADDSGNED